MTNSGRYVPSSLGSDKIYEGNPFLLDDISGKQNPVLDAVRNPTNCLVYRNNPPVLHFIAGITPTVLQLVGRDIQSLPVIPEGVNAVFLRENQIRSLNELSSHPSIELLDISCNLIKEFDLENPGDCLKALIVSSNSMDKIVTKTIFTKLELLNLSQNYLTTFPSDQFVNLRILNLSFNKLTFFELDHPYLLELSLQNNKLRTFQIKNAGSLLRLDISSNKLDDLSFTEHIKDTITHFSAHNNKFGYYWESEVITKFKKIVSVNGRVLTEGEKAIHRDRYRLQMRRDDIDKPNDLICTIRRQFRQIKQIEVDALSCPDDIVSVWLTRSQERVNRHKLIVQAISNMKSYYYVDKNQCLIVYGALVDVEYVSSAYRSVQLRYSPIIKGPIERNVINLAKRNPVMLTLDHNMLNTLDDILFLRYFRSVTILSVDGNLVSKMSIFRRFIAYLMPNVNVINGIQVTQSERDSGSDYFASLLEIAKGFGPG